MDTRLLTLTEVARFLGLSPASLYRQRYVGDPPGSLGFRVGRHVRFRRVDLEMWIEGQMASSGDDGQRGDRGR
jgi:predicted DNA-binding transcriptional regulator AlpA